MLNFSPVASCISPAQFPHVPPPHLPHSGGTLDNSFDFIDSWIWPV